MSSQPTFTWSTTAGTITKYGLLTAPNATVSDGMVTASSSLGSSTAAFTVNNVVSPLAATLSAPSRGAILSGVSASLTGTDTRKTLQPVDYALALAGTWLDNSPR
jgi:hypothetical protein